MKTLNLVYYSPTATTQKVLKEIANNMEAELIVENNITRTDNELNYKISDDCLTIIGMPVYSGRLPIEAIDRLKQFKAHQTPAVIVVVYGNRAFDDALLELKEVAESCGFVAIAAAAFIGEHTYSSIDQPIAANRPDREDLVKCKDFAKIVSDKMRSFTHSQQLMELSVPGNFPYKERKPLPEVYPETDDDLCNACGTCLDVCPTNAISMVGTTIKTEGELCTWCCACVKHCPNEARIFDNSIINAVKDRLFLNCSERKEPAFFV